MKFLFSLLLFIMVCDADGFKGEIIKEFACEGDDYDLLIDTCCPKSLILSVGGKKGGVPVYYDDHHLGVFEATFSYNRGSRGRDGILGWPAIKKAALWLKVGEEKYELLPKKLPGLMNDSVSYPLKEYKGYCMFNVPGYGAVFLDTGHKGGVVLGHKKWEMFAQKNSEYKKSIYSVMLYGGREIFDLEGVPQFSYDMGDLRLHTSVSQSFANHVLPEDHTLIGLSALKNYEVLIDGPNEVIHFKKAKNKKWDYQPYNQIQASFLGTSIEFKKSPHVIRVLEGGFAYQQGLRDGYLLLKINGKTPSQDYLSKKLNDVGAKVKMKFEDAKKQERKIEFRVPKVIPIEE